MSSAQVERLVNMVHRLVSSDRPDPLRPEAEQMVREATPQDLTETERRLLEEGGDQRTLEELCEIHLRVLSEQVDAFRRSLPPDHPLEMLMTEHQLMLRLLAELERVNEEVGRTGEPTEEQMAELRRIAQGFADTQPLHQHEEEVFFRELEARGEAERVAVLRREHVPLDERREALLALTWEAGQLPAREFTDRVNEITQYLVLNLRDHVFREDLLLYPYMEEKLDNPEEWREIRRRANAIRHCRFTPGL